MFSSIKKSASNLFSTKNISSWTAFYYDVSGNFDRLKTTI